MKKIILLALVAVVALTAVLIFLIGRNDAPGAPTPSGQDALVGERSFAPATPPPSTRHIATPLSVNEAISNGDPREGYILAPTIVGLGGVDMVSAFALQTPAAYEGAFPAISIDGQEAPTIVREDSRTFLITPAIPLTPNSVYVFRLGGDNGPEITWAFQTAPYFEITATLPRNQSTNVPVNTGIEVEFSFGSAIDIEDYFSIYPQVEGRFIHRGSTAIFMPTSSLEAGQIYTVTIGAGVSLAGGEEQITTDHVFSFETAPEEGEEWPWDWGSRLHFSSSVVEFPSFAAPSVNFWMNYDRGGQRPAIEMTLHRLADRTQGIEAVNRLVGVPHWAQFAQVESLIDTSDLTRVFSTSVTQSLGISDWGDETFTFPDALPPGFYVLTARVGDTDSQVIVQVTDLAVQMLADNDRALLWIHDMTTGLPAGGARVYDRVGNSTEEVSPYGIAVIERDVSFGEYLVIVAADGREGVVFAHSFGFSPFHGGWGDWGWGWGSPRGNNYYWTALQLDRTLFQRSDTLSLWGFVQNRQEYETISHVTAVLTEQRWWHSPEGDVLHRQNIPVSYGAYSGEIRLPHLDPGSYELAIYHGEILLSATFFTVMDYVTPPYRLSVSASRNAIFAGEEVTFTARAAFFEGTPVPDLQISHDLWGWDVTGSGGGSGQTDLEGILEVTARPAARDASVHGERSLFFSAEATLPEIGWTHQSAQVRVFVNDIDLRPEGTRSGSDASLSIDVHEIDLSRINDGTDTGWDDFRGNPVGGQGISVEILEQYWVPIREGERYDHVTRQVIPRYRYEQRERSLERFEMTTDAQGHATRDFQVPDRTHASYLARLTTTDGNGRRITQDVFIGRDFSWFHWNAGDNQLFLDGVNEEGYDIGDEVELTVMQGTEPVTQGNFLFVTVQNGILHYQIGRNPLTFSFREEHVPNVQVYAFHFNGHTYQSGWHMSQRLRFATADRNLDIAISTCQEAYRPGDTVTLTITTRDMEGNPKGANVNISLVDEALFALMEYTKDTLAMLYGHVDDNLRLQVASHGTFVSEGLLDDMAVQWSAGGAAPAAMAVPEAAAMEAEEDSYGGSGDGGRIRQRFEDTAIFRSLRTNDRGEASFSFTLPDNITSWRVTASAISEDLYAGNTLENLQVTQPMFLHYSLNSSFLVGDRPYIGVNAYGTSLSGGEEVLFEVWREEAPGDIRSARGVSFERVNIPLWEMGEEGFGSLIIRATVGTYSDGVQHSYQVVSSHRQVDRAVFYEVGPDTVFSVPARGMTNITFMDLGRGQFLDDLMGMRHSWRSGARIEGHVARREATALIQSHFPDVPLFGEAGRFDIGEYQTESGGIAILPYAEADLETTVALIPFILDDVNLVALRGYLYDILNTSTTENRMLALYGLALLGEPVLLELQRYASLPDLSVRNTAYVALGLAVLGETHRARELYTGRIAPHIVSAAPYYRVDTGGDRREMLDATSITAILAAKLGISEGGGLHSYAARHRSQNPLIQIETLTFISHEIENHTDSAASITYSLLGETVTRELGHGGTFVLRIPVQNMREFRLISTTGEVGAVSIIRTPLEEITLVERDLTVRREFFKAGSNVSTNTFDQGDLVRVQITVDYSARSMSGAYVITDFLPAGLVHVANSARVGDIAATAGWWTHVTTEGQRITFFDYNRRFYRTNTYFFYARAVNPGTFLAEGTLVQSFGAREYLVVGEDATVTIRG